MRDYLHVMDLAEGHILALDALAKAASESGVFESVDVKKDGYFRAFNLGRGKGMSVIQMVEAMRAASGFDYKYEIVGRRCVFLPNQGAKLTESRLGDVPDLTADPAVAQKELGFLASRDLDSMTRDLWNFISKHPNGYASSH